MYDLSGTVLEESGEIDNLRTLRLAGTFLGGCLPLTMTQVSNSDRPDTGLPSCE